MPKRMGFSAARASLAYIRDNADVLRVLSTAAISYAQTTSQSGNQLVSANVSAADFSIASGSTGPVLTIAQKTNHPIDINGQATHVALTRASSTSLLLLASVSAQALETGNFVDVPSWTVTHEQSAGVTATSVGVAVAFPGAVGFGRNSIGGRGGQVIKVTNLNASGPGSLKAAIDTVGPRIIVFEIGGLITIPEANGYLTISNPFCTIAGETAPSPGIHITGRGIKVAASNVILRHITVRLDSTNGISEYVNGDVGIWVTQPSATQLCDDIIIDHCTTQYCPYLAVATGPTSAITPRRVTISNCLFLEGVLPFRSGFLATQTTGLTMFRNVFGYFADRTPFLNPITNNTSLPIEYINNIAYNGSFGQESIIIGNNQSNADGSGQVGLQPIYASIINNRYPATVDQYPMIWHNDGIENRSNQVYHSGNDRGVKSLTYQNLNSFNPLVGSPPADSGLATGLHGTILTAGASMETDILTNVGSRPRDRDAAATRAVNRIISRTGTIGSSVSGFGGAPTLSPTSQIYNIPANPSGDDDSDGYTNIEEDLHAKANAWLF
jgi:hypothetical protein